MSLVFRIGFILFLSLPLSTLASASTDGFNLTLERTGCLGTCPDYKVTIQGDGSLEYEGRYYVHIKGIRQKKLSSTTVQKLEQILQEEDFFNWKAGGTCLDTSETHITATLNGVQKHVMEGCNAQGKISKLANQIEKITGVRRWI